MKNFRNARHIGLALALTLFSATFYTCFPAVADDGGRIAPGELMIIGEEPKQNVAPVCPLEHTDVVTDIVGFIARTTVRQIFTNPLDRKIEAVYVFPLPQDAAVDDMTMLVGDRRVVGLIKERSEAREIYEQAKAAGHVAGLLDQERPNIFTQSVANIEPGARVEIEISFVETLKYEDGVFEWVFPMVVGPRYIPGGGTPQSPMTTGSPTAEVPDADKITPPIIPEGMRAGHDISIAVSIDAGLPIQDLESKLHEINAATDGPTRVEVTLTDQAAIPNKDFILRYTLATDEIGDAFLAHHDERGDFFTLILQPPRRVVPEQLVARELIFVLDTSGSMRGFPIDKAKELMSSLIETMRPGDTFNLITFAGHTNVLWDKPRPNTEQNRREAQALIMQQRGGGGTEMMKAIHAALVQTRGPRESDALRVVCFLTDGYVGNDMAIIDAIRKNADTTRVFSFGVGNSVNRYLMDGMAYAGRGEAEYVTLESQADSAVARFHERILAPVLTHIEIDWGTLPVAEIYPKQIPDLFSAKPIMVHGRLTGPAEGAITLRGLTGAGAYEETIEVSLPGEPPDHDALASLWARAKVADLMNRDLNAVQHGNFPEELKQQIIDIGVEHRLLTQFTSFVAVEEMTVTVGGEPTKINVPVEMPDGVSYEGIFGAEQSVMSMRRSPAKMKGGARSTANTFGGGGGLRGRGARAGRPAPQSPPVKLEALGYAGQVDEDAEEDRRDAQRKRANKLAQSLQNLAEKVEKRGEAGNLTLGAMKVVDYKVDVMVYLSDVSEATLGALTDLGFVQTGESKAVKLLIGTMDVRKLEDLAKLDAVIRIKPVSE